MIQNCPTCNHLLGERYLIAENETDRVLIPSSMKEKESFSRTDNYNGS